MPGKPNSAARITLVTMLAAVLVLSGCATVVSGSGHSSGLPTGTTSGDFPSSASASTPGTTASGPTTAAPPTSSASIDITDVKYTVPTGWDRSSSYDEVKPLETKFQAKYLIPGGVTPGLDVISIVLYRLPGPHLVDTRAQQVTRIESYNQKRGVQIKKQLADTTVGGRSAFDETVVQPGDAHDYNYATWFVFGGAHVVQISCQFDSLEQKVSDGCQTLLASMTFS